MSDTPQLILYIRLDDFYVQVERQLVPSLRRQPLVIGRERIESCSPEARELGLRVGMKLARARRRAKRLIVIHGHDQIYRCKADEIWHLCRHYTQAMETYPTEAWGNATGMHYVHGSPCALALDLQRQIHQATALPVTLGLGRNRLFAWIAAASAKPGQVGYLRPYEEVRVLSRFPLHQLPGLRPITRDRLRDLNLRVLHDLQSFSRDQLRSLCGPDGDLLYERCRGLDRQTIDASARPTRLEQQAPLDSPTSDCQQLQQHLYQAIERATRRLREIDLRTQRLELTITYDDGKIRSRRRKLAAPTHCDNQLFRLAETLLDQLQQRRVALRQLHLGLDQLTQRTATPSLFGDDPLESRDMYKTIDQLRHRFGDACVKKLEV